jgi:cytidylate kinase
MGGFRIRRGTSALRMDSNVVFCGRLGSGKTTISRAVAETLGVRWNSFGSVCKKIAREQGTSIDRESLQILGEYLVANSAEDFCRRVLAEAQPMSHRCIVIDGLRHSHVHKILQTLSLPRKLLCVYIEINNSIRLQRLALREGLTEDNARKLELHSTEVEVAGRVRQLANLTVDNSGDLAQTVENVVTFLRRPRDTPQSSS